MKKTFIKDLKVGSAIFGEIFAVKAYKRGATRNNKPFVDIELSDKTGAVKGKIWSDDLSNTEEVKPGDVVFITGTVEEFMNAPQVKITNMKKTESFDLSELQQSSAFDQRKMWQEVESKIEEVKNPHLKALLANVFDKDFTEKFINAPAAYKLHHNYKGGLLEHTWEMLKMAEPLKNHYPRMNMDLVNTGIILHDVGKVEELEMETTITHTNKGKLLGHLYIGAEIVKHHAPKDMPEDLLNEVLHIVLAHLGVKEYGSPRVPMTVEAMAVFVLDYTSFRIRMAYDQIEGETGSDFFTQYVSHLGTELYRSPYQEDPSEEIPF